MNQLNIAWQSQGENESLNFVLPLRKTVHVGNSDRCDVQMDTWKWNDVELVITNDRSDPNAIEVTSRTVAEIHQKGRVDVFGNGQTKTIILDSTPVLLEIKKQPVWLSRHTPEQSDQSTEQVQLDSLVNEAHASVSKQRLELNLEAAEIDNQFCKLLDEQKLTSADIVRLFRSNLKRLLFEDLFGSSETFRCTRFFNQLLLKLQAWFVKQFLEKRKLVRGKIDFYPTLIQNRDQGIRYKSVGIPIAGDQPTNLSVSLAFERDHVLVHFNGKKDVPATQRLAVQSYAKAIYSRLEVYIDSIVKKVSQADLQQVAMQEFRRQVVDLKRFGPLTRYFDKELKYITDVSLDQNGNVFLILDGSFFPIQEKVLGQSLEKAIGGIQRKAKAKFDMSTPILNCEVNGVRVNLVNEKLGSKHQVTLRRKFLMRLTLDELCRWGTFPVQCQSFLSAIMKSGKRLVVSGGLGSGKTSLLIAMLSALAPNMKIATIEDTREIELPEAHHFCSMVTDENHDEHALLKSILRSSANLIALGEIRSPAAADAMVNALNTGQIGITTLHSNSARDTVTRLVNLLCLAQNTSEQSASHSLNSALDFIIHVRRSDDGQRHISEICEVNGLDTQTGRLSLKPIFEWVDGMLVPTGMLPKSIVELNKHGFEMLDFDNF